VDEEGRRCPERHRLEYHHRDPYARGGGKDSGNICLMCRQHNWYLAEIEYGKEAMSRYRRTGGPRRKGTRSEKSSAMALRDGPSPGVDGVGSSAGEARESDPTS
jgi:hypothetical protein